jgi:hypothetical protein|uniref:Uncharacterized protein n=1 Tax=Sipha flava TaxID=143950 RepID=A0A2S2R2I0_9HEMI
MLSAVFPVVRLPYDQPDRVARVLDTIRCELKASRQQSVTAVTAPKTTVAFLEPSQWSSATMTVRVQQLHQQARELEKISVAESTTVAAGDVSNSAALNVDQTVDQVTVGVRDCTLTPKVRPEILVTTGSQPARNYYFGEQHSVPSAVQSNCGRPYLLVPPINITSEISRPPPTALHQYTATSSTSFS